MIPGYNHSVKHRGSVYHVQTEDSGLQNPVISTHLFLGGNVLASRRTSYAEFARSADAEPRVRKLMQEQHKDVLRQLIRGAYDREVAKVAVAYQPGELAEAPASSVPPPVAPAAAPATAVAPERNVAAPVRAGPSDDAPPVLPRVSRPAAPPVLIPEIDDEDLLSDRRLDEVILAYLAEVPGTKRGE